VARRFRLMSRVAMSRVVWWRATAVRLGRVTLWGRRGDGLLVGGAVPVEDIAPIEYERPSGPPTCQTQINEETNLSAR
jgi:hypothetical protein